MCIWCCGRAGGRRQAAFIYQLEIDSSEALYRIERNGVLIDAPTLAAQSHELGQRIMQLEAEAHDLAGQPFNLGSPKQIGEIFFGKLGLPVVKKTATGAPSTDEEVLEKLAEDFPLPAKILEHRGLAKLKGTYTDKLAQLATAAHGPGAHPLRAGGGRDRAPVQQRPQPAEHPDPHGRRAAGARGLRGAGRLCDCQRRLQPDRAAHHGPHQRGRGPAAALHEGMDVHRATAAEVFGLPPEQVSTEQRRYAKVINFGLIYGMSAFGLARSLGIDNTAAKNYIERYFQRYEGVKRYMDETREQARDKGYVETVFGRRLYLPEIQLAQRPAAQRCRAPGHQRADAGHGGRPDQAQHEQGAAGARQRTARHEDDHAGARRTGVRGAAIEVDWLKTEIPRLMAGVAALKVPLLAEVGVGLNWDKAH
jgi:DNA polymerase-1